MKRTVVLGCLALCLGLSQANAGEIRESNKYMIELKGGIPANLEKLVADSGGTLLRVLPQIGKAVVVAPDTAFASRMSRHRQVAAVHRDMVLQWTEPLGPAIQGLETAPVAAGDPTEAALFPCQWQLRQIDAPEAWAQGALGSPSAKVAVIDTGVDPFHIDLEGRIDEEHSTSLLLPGTSACGADDENTFHDYAGHGTFMASMVTTNGINIAAVAPETQVVAFKVINCEGEGEFSDIITAILQAADIPDVSVISLSIGGFVRKTDPGAKEFLRFAKESVDYAFSQGKLVVAVSGNQSTDLRGVRPLVAVPTESGQAIGVYATDVRDQLASYSNWGWPASWIGAPGGDNNTPRRPFAGCPLPVEQQGRILGACSSFVCGGAKDQYITGRGTSVSAPVVAGVAALVDGQHDGVLSPRRLKVILKNRADDLGEPGTDPIFGHGRVNAGRAVNHN